MPTLKVPRLRPDQSFIARHLETHQVITCIMGRRYGKSTMGAVIALDYATRGMKVAWIAPTYKNSRPLWRTVEHFTYPLVRSKHAHLNRSEHTAVFPTTRGFLGVYSGDNEHSIRGESFHLVIIDEAARCRDTLWSEAVMPTLADFGGRAMLISTPAGRNWLWEEYLRGQPYAIDRHPDGRYNVIKKQPEGLNLDPHYVCFHAPTTANPSPNIQQAARLAKERITERRYWQEWLAMFLPEGGGVFRNVERCAIGQPQGRVDGHSYIIGADWARSASATADFSCFAVFDATERRMVYLDRFKGVEFAHQIMRLKALAERYGPEVRIIPETNAMGGPLVEQLQREGMSVIPFTMNNASKQDAVDMLIMALEQEHVVLLDHPVLKDELMSFEAITSASGIRRYTAPSNKHDDTVVATMLAHYGMAKHPPMIIGGC